jgi:hypothetical protein
MDVTEKSHEVFQRTKDYIYRREFGSLLFLEGFVSKNTLRQLYLLWEATGGLSPSELRFDIDLKDQCNPDTLDFITRHSIKIVDSKEEVYISFRDVKNAYMPVKTAIDQKITKDTIDREIEEDDLITDVLENILKKLKNKKEKNEYNRL